ncbi:MAG TPA: glycosyltransferase [Bacillales bacterium]|nr:glycosyltransferase [Bacillales bacterium]
MNTIHLLFLTSDQSDQMEKSSHYLAEAMKQYCSVTVWTEDGHMSDILSRIDDEPDFILLNDCFAPPLCPNIYGLNSVSIPKWMIFHDLFIQRQQRKRFVTEQRIDYFFPHYRDSFIKWYPQLADRMIWLPHHANTAVYKDYEQDKDIDWLMMGAVDRRLYPLRSAMKQTFSGMNGFVFHPHPGHRHEKEIEPGSFIADNYARQINRAKIFLTCGTKFRHPVMKYFEVLACNTLLLAPGSKELADLGFVDGETFVSVERNNFYDKAVYYLDHEEERRRITANGHKMVMENHSTNRRAQQVIDQIERRIEQKN